MFSASCRKLQAGSLRSPIGEIWVVRDRNLIVRSFGLDARRLNEMIVVARSERARRMSAPTDSHLEIAHVLFIDIVAYSKLLIDQQTELIKLLNEQVHGTEEFRTAEAAGKLIRIATGDGMALAFFTSPMRPGAATKRSNQPITSCSSCGRASFRSVNNLEAHLAGGAGDNAESGFVVACIQVFRLRLYDVHHLLACYFTNLNLVRFF